MFWPLFAFTPIPLPAWGNISSDQLGYDGVGRMITKRYLTGGINGTTYAYNNTTALVADTTSFDRAGNKLYERHLEAESRSHLYQPFNSDGSFGVGYDSANRMLQYQRGVLSSATIPYRVNPGASITTPITLPGTDQVKTYGLDGLGNWKTSNSTLVGSGGSTTSTAEVRQHNYVNEITSVKDTTGGTPTTTPFAYDHGNNTDGIKGNGNLVNDGVREYQYDGFNRLIQVSTASGTVLATYQYDAFDRRVQKTIFDLGGGFGGLTGDIPAGVTDYFYDGQQIVEQRNDAAPTVWTQVNFWGQYIDELLFLAVPTATVYRVLSDLLYRSVAMVTTANVVTEAYDTDAYGNTLCYSSPGADGLWFTDDDVTTNNPVNSTIFTGRQYDPESQIYYYRARYYSPAIGRFISRDPLGSPLMMASATEPRGSAELSQGPNLYWYVQDNPANQTDPSGQKCCCKDAMDEKVKIVLDAATWNSTSPGWSFSVPGREGNECAEQALHLEDYLSQKGFKCWSFIVIGGAQYSPGGYNLMQHNVLEVNPKAIVPPCPDATSFTLDPFKSPGGYNSKGAVKCSTPDDFKKTHPHPL